MIKMLAAACRKPGMTHAEFVAYVYRVHAKISRENPVTLARYLQNHVFDAAYGTASQPHHALPTSHDSVTELFWPSLEAMQATFANDHVRTKVGPDGANFSDLQLTLSMVAVEAEQAVINPNYESATTKVLHFVRALPELSLQEFFTRWSAAHEQALEENPLAAATLRRCVHNRQIPEANKFLAYFGQQPVPVYEGIGALWYDNESCVGAFRAYEKTLLELNKIETMQFYNPEQSFFLYANEALILGEF